MAKWDQMIYTVAAEAAIEAGGGPVGESPSGVVIHVPRQPLDDIDREKDAAFCGEMARDRDAEGLPRRNAGDRPRVVDGRFGTCLRGSSR